MVTVWTILAITAARHWSLSQLDVTNAFLHGDLTEEIYMSPPPGLRRQGENLVCCPNKSLYGLKQASRQWFAKFTEAVQATGFVQSKADYSLFICKRGKSFTALLIYVDDIVITGNDENAIIFHLKMSLQNIVSFLCFLLMLVMVSAQWPNVTVTVDGTGDYRSIVDAVGVIPNNCDSMFFIYIKASNYTENVYICIEKRNEVMSGDGIGKTNIIFSCNNRTSFTIDQSAALDDEKFYAYSVEGIGLLFNFIYMLVAKATFDGHNYQSVDKFSVVQKSLVESKMEQAYKNVNNFDSVDGRAIFGPSSQQATGLLHPDGFLVPRSPRLPCQLPRSPVMTIGDSLGYGMRLFSAPTSNDSESGNIASVRNSHSMQAVDPINVKLSFFSIFGSSIEHISMTKNRKADWCRIQAVLLDLAARRNWVEQTSKIVKRKQPKKISNYGGLRKRFA
ncbi:hypothetical protein EZV62_006505 [Acer yangbiense]|uniref:Uncharacterized protein n=1 Tax=Acer yangbiense TaxID=1000413 RepID=A0A5C7I7D7_9ROSI|nr:hypothetical protein EZV62_006505 [Acer yangbiense]